MSDPHDNPRIEVPATSGFPPYVTDAFLECVGKEFWESPGRERRSGAVYSTLIAIYERADKRNPGFAPVVGVGTGLSMAGFSKYEFDKSFDDNTALYFSNAEYQKDALYRRSTQFNYYEVWQDPNNTSTTHSYTYSDSISWETGVPVWGSIGLVELLTDGTPSGYVYPYRELANEGAIYPITADFGASTQTLFTGEVWSADLHQQKKRRGRTADRTEAIQEITVENVVGFSHVFGHTTAPLFGHGLPTFQDYPNGYAGLIAFKEVGYDGNFPVVPSRDYSKYTGEALFDTPFIGVPGNEIGVGAGGVVAGWGWGSLGFWAQHSRIKVSEFDPLPFRDITMLKTVYYFDGNPVTTLYLAQRLNKGDDIFVEIPTFDPNAISTEIRVYG